MKTKFWSVIWFASAGTAIGYAMREGFRHFAASEDPARVLGYLSVAVATSCAVVGMIAVWRSFSRQSDHDRSPRASTTTKPNVA
jgi:hypothetical protein